MKKNNKELSGLIAAPHTPMHEDYSVNLDTIYLQADTLNTNGVNGVFLCGTTGEGVSLTEMERKQVGVQWADVASEELSIIVHVGATTLAQAKRLARHAEEKIQADAIAAMGPVVFKTATVESLVNYCAEIASAAPNTPFYYYHIPSFSGIDLPMIEFLELGSKQIPTLSGIKYTDSDLYDYGLCLDYENGKYNILFGQDENLLAGLALGANGAVGSTYNFASPLYLRIIEYFQAGDLDAANRLQAKSRKMVRAMKGYGIFASLKAAMRIIGVDCGPNRPPVDALSDDEIAALTSELEDIGFFDFCSSTESEVKAVGIQ